MDSYNKRNFWEAFVIALFIFGVGILLGFLIEANRASRISEDFQLSELSMLDMRAQSDLFDLNNIECGNALNETISFANRIYDEARQLEKYEGANQIGKEIIQQHKKYDILRALLFANTLKIKEKCNSSFYTLLYLYEYQTEDIEKRSRQEIFSNKLLTLKNEKGEKLLLIPLAGNIESNSIAYIMKVYGISSLPTILINEKYKIETIEELKNISSILAKS